MIKQRTDGKGREAVFLEVTGVNKRFGGVHALRDVSLKLMEGEIHGIVGENGAGKSTLIKIISGVERPDSGEIRLRNQVVSIDAPLDAMGLGIGTVYQELSLVPQRTVAQNIFCLREPKNRAGLIDVAEMNHEAGLLMKRLGLDIAPHTLVGDLRIADQQIVEIAKVLSRRPELLILDEPTSSLSKVEIGKLFELLHKLKQSGIIITFISHKLDEILQITDSITVLRDGSVTGEMRTAEADMDTVIELMVGRKLEAMFPEKASRVGQPILSVKNFSLDGVFDEVNFDLYEGEVLGVFGLVGAGRTPLAQAICGCGSKDSGELVLAGQKLDIRSPRDAINSGLVYMTEDRLGDGLFIRLGVLENILASSLDRYSRMGFLSKATTRRVAQKMINLLGIVTPGRTTRVIELSGGNQQKVLLGKTLCAEPRVLVADEPTRGIDVGAKADVHAWLRRLASEGVGIIMISSELPEILGMSDRIMVMHGGKVKAIVDANGVTEESVLSYCYAPSTGDAVPH